jgi:hypothetical protein
MAAVAIGLVLQYFLWTTVAVQRYVGQYQIPFQHSLALVIVAPFTSLAELCEQVENSHELRGRKPSGDGPHESVRCFCSQTRERAAADIAPPLARPYVSCSLATATNDPLASWQVASTAPAIPLQNLPTSRTCFCCSSPE